MENLYEITGNLLAAFVVGLLAYLVPKARAWLQANTDAATQENVRKLVQSFARAAEQLYYDQDPDGQKRQQFVQEQLRAMGVVVTEAVINMIEGAVWEINTENKKALSNDMEQGLAEAVEKVKGSSVTIMKSTTIFDSDHTEYNEETENGNS